MDMQEKLNNKKQKLQIIEDALKEEIYSQLKYLEYNERKEKLEKDIKQLEQNLERHNNKTKKIWIDMGNGWKKRINTSKDD